MAVSTYYAEDLAYIQASGFGGFARNVGPDLLALLGALAMPVRRLVDIGCGAGVTTRAFCDAGYDVVGIEPSVTLAAYAREAAPKAQILAASAYDAELPGCEAIFAVGEALGYHEDTASADSRVQRFFGAAHAALIAGGLLAFDVIATGAPDLSGRNWTAGADWAVLTDITEDQPERVLVRAIEIFRARAGLYRRSQECHRVRLFEASELKGWLTDSGFHVEIGDSYGAHPLLPRRIAVVARKR